MNDRDKSGKKKAARSSHSDPKRDALLVERAGNLVDNTLILFKQYDSIMLNHTHAIEGLTQRSLNQDMFLDRLEGALANINEKLTQLTLLPNPNHMTDIIPVRPWQAGELKNNETNIEDEYEESELKDDYTLDERGFMTVRERSPKFAGSQTTTRPTSTIEVGHEGSSSQKPVIKRYHRQLITKKWLKVLNLPMAITNKQVLEQVAILKEYYYEAMKIRQSPNFKQRARYFNMHPFSQDPRDLDMLIEQIHFKWSRVNCVDEFLFEARFIQNRSWSSLGSFCKWVIQKEKKVMVTCPKNNSIVIDLPENVARKKGVIPKVCPSNTEAATRKLDKKALALEKREKNTSLTKFMEPLKGRLATVDRALPDIIKPSTTALQRRPSLVQSDKQFNSDLEDKPRIKHKNLDVNSNLAQSTRAFIEEKVAEKNEKLNHIEGYENEEREDECTLRLRLSPEPGSYSAPGSSSGSESCSGSGSESGVESDPEPDSDSERLIKSENESEAGSSIE